MDITTLLILIIVFTYTVLYLRGRVYKREGFGSTVQNRTERTDSSGCY